MAADERVLTFLQQQNRPYNAQGVTDHLAQFGVKKAQAQKALDALSESGKINCKEFGKTKIYTALQEAHDDLSKEEMDSVQRTVTELKAKTENLSSSVRAKQKELQALQCSLTSEQIAAKTAELQHQLQEAEARLQTLRSGSTLITAEERQAVEKAFLAYTDAWNKRKRVFKSIWEQVSENIEQNAQDLFEEMGVETDEAAGASLAQVQQLMPKRARR
ncbi:g4116 [Coccomyxa viridis]|uniref:Homologous-pairing protein 2 homolog n=1 Tax=Coccomyxa viridis TaxID=1274662 RepID=A0ABP1FPG8_9CHLO